ncbi:GNAT family N-acetyltransferase [Nonomuraea roseoviolacea subsp. roseoviolacea]|uniref:GNAT superfamily N-acetyltransferase n=1 Tax=Nonomuraea roseoviolacea subsp. carminata TaxID=160689 RepID=A0ABT1JQD4_9ACTN|nr:GNAT family N-acetyltransferase [Nonomuraea roseoviolacea]MCP2343937.1 GNAT superfamily N-acetyltransferase [Nonomuraea roseoviolacea subsp. carminata]
MHILSSAEPDTPDDLRAQVVALHDQAWPPGDPSEAGDIAPTHDPRLQPLSMLLVNDGQVLAALDILSKDITHDGRRFRAGGLSTVVTREESRGQGHGRRLVTAAHEVLAGSGADLGLFTCDAPLQAFYESAGWHVLPGAVLIGGTPDNPFPSDRPGFDKVTMADFFTDRARRHQAAFRHSRIELYPGEIDKLW